MTAAAQAAAEAAFDTDLHRAAVAPVFLTVTNRSRTVIEFSRHDASAFARDGRRCRMLMLREAYERIRFYPVGRYFAWSLGLFGIGIVPGIIDHFKAEAANRAIWQDLEHKQIRDGAIAPGRSLSGFLFLDAKDGPPERLVVMLAGAEGAPVEHTVPLAYIARAGDSGR